MKVLSIRFDDSADLSQFVKGQPVTVTKDDISTDGHVLFSVDVDDLHTHPAKTVIGPPVPPAPPA